MYLYIYKYIKYNTCFIAFVCLPGSSPPLQTPQQVRPGDETCFPLCYLHNVQHVCQALTLNTRSKQRCSVCCTGAAWKHEILFKICVCVFVWFHDFDLGFVITVMQTEKWQRDTF